MINESKFNNVSESLKGFQLTYSQGFLQLRCLFFHIGSKYSSIRSSVHIYWNIRYHMFCMVFKNHRKVRKTVKSCPWRLYYSVVTNSVWVCHIFHRQNSFLPALRVASLRVRHKVINFTLLEKWRHIAQKLKRINALSANCKAYYSSSRSFTNFHP